MSTHKTSFFRHANQINTFEKIVDELIAARRLSGKKRLKIWSATCSTGEEPYTLAMIVREKLAGERDWDISVQGTDTSSGSIAQARRGRFAARGVRNVPETYLSKYFQADPQYPNYYTLSPELANAVQFDVLSLIDDGQATTRCDFDIVFCRNVLIYFDNAAKKKVLETLWQSLVPGGYLVLGPSDSLHGLTDIFQRTQYSVYKFFQRAPESTAVEAAAPNSAPSAAAPIEAAPSLPPLPTGRNTGQSLHLKLLIQRLDRGIRDLSQDLNNSLGKTIDAVSTITTALETLGQSEDCNAKTHAELQGTDRQLMRILLYLQVDDRTQQKTEALRATLQQLSDSLLGAEKEAPDLQVNVTSFDENILPEDEQDKDQTEDNPLSQDEIDALFN